ncbi:hypothetical protein FIBSPDRAFT_872615 [Athelia psychrophila]|uniref:Uncharacterized protein n=1 Tax=Athelia psychrophila TaxID=1759441 RepID=A0A165ZB37_9AGAM|nr:hypothetical protein FIBSPDRAFT_872615 [Fibularhizoctonia sp. CBS 109695]
MESIYGLHHSQWVEPLKVKYDTILQTYRRDEARLHSLALMKLTRGERWSNKTRELDHDRRGEVVARRIWQPPSADMLAKLSGQERRMDQVA